MTQNCHLEMYELILIFSVGIIGHVYHLRSLRRRKVLQSLSEDAEEIISLEGGCHCGRVRFSFKTPRHSYVWQCNCSICVMKQNHHIVVPDDQFSLLQGADALTTYTFNTHAAKHTFCKHCGVQSFYKPRSNPSGRGITLFCIDRPYPEGFRYDYEPQFDGENWEKHYASTAGSKIKRFSGGEGN